MAERNSVKQAVTGTQSPGQALTPFRRIREAARKDSELRFNNLMHHINVELLWASYRALKRNAASGVDQLTWKEYGTNIGQRLQSLHERVQSGRYKALPSRRIYLEKPDGRKRPIGIAALEDKIVQQATVQLLQQIYEVDFAGFSYGFRPGRNQHQALDALWVGIYSKKVNWILDADIKSFFDTIDHKWLRKMLERRIADKRLLRLIGKWLRAGVLEDGLWSATPEGTPQGAVISPMLSNIYLHYVLDIWVRWWRDTKAKGEMVIVRYADDFVMGFQYESDARRWLQDAKERFARFNLKLHEDKTRLIEFGRFAQQRRKARGQGRPETFDFLGFTHMCDKRKKNGTFTILRHTIAKRLKSTLEKVKQKLRKRMHEKIASLGRWLRSVVQGFFNYHAVPGNIEALEAFRREINRIWYKILRRRSQRARKKITWKRMNIYIRRWIPNARILHPYPDERLCVNYSKQEPYAGKPPVRICAGGAR